MTLDIILQVIIFVGLSIIVTSAFFYYKKDLELLLRENENDDFINSLNQLKEFILMGLLNNGKTMVFKNIKKSIIENDGHSLPKKDYVSFFTTYIHRSTTMELKEFEVDYLEDKSIIDIDGKLYSYNKMVDAILNEIIEDVISDNNLKWLFGKKVYSLPKK
jgi:hypothetical protein